MDARSLLQTLDLDSARCIVAIGAGGKTSCLRSLASDMTTTGLSVISTTTTRIWVPAVGSVLVAAQEPQLRRLLTSHLKRSRQVTAASHIDASGKLRGLEPTTVCRLMKRFPSVRMLVEADGAAGRPLKAHGLGEPLIPSCADVVFMIVGTWALGETADASTVHRIESLHRQTAAREGELLDSKLVARLMCSYRRAVPPAARTIALLNGSEIVRSTASVRELKTELRQLWPELKVVCTIRGRPFDVNDQGA